MRFALALELFHDVEVERAELSLLLEAEAARAAGDDSPAGGKELLGVVFDGGRRLPGLGVAKAEAGRRSGSLEIGVARRRCGLRPGDHLHQRDVLGRLRRFRLRRPSRPVVMMLMHRCVRPPETARTGASTSSPRAWRAVEGGSGRWKSTRLNSSHV